MTVINWEQMLEFVGMKVVPSDDPHYRFKVVREHGVLVSYGDTIEDAARGQNIDWTSVRNKISNLEWERMARL